MRYVILSLTIHLLVLWALTLNLTRATDSQDYQAVMVEMIFEPIAAPQPFSEKLLSGEKTHSKAYAEPLDLEDKVSKDASHHHEASDHQNESNLNRRSEAVTLSYSEELKLFIEKNKHYPRQAIRMKQTGVVKIQVMIDKNGIFRDVHLIEASSFPVLNRAAVELIQKLGRFKPLPKSIGKDSYFTIPVAYVLRRG